MSLWSDDGIIITVSPHGGDPWEYLDTYLCGGRWSRGGADTYMVSFACVLVVFMCPVNGLPLRVHNPGRLRKQFIHSHWKANIATLKEVPETFMQCDNCGMYMPASILEKHNHTARCDRET